MSDITYFILAVTIFSKRFWIIAFLIIFAFLAFGCSVFDYHSKRVWEREHEQKLQKREILKRLSK